MLTCHGQLCILIVHMPDKALLPQPSMYRDVGKLVRAHRRKRKLSQATLAQQVGHTRTSVTNIEAGRQRIPLDVLFSMASALHVDIRELLPVGVTSLPPDLQKKIPREYDQSQLRALRRVVGT